MKASGNGNNNSWTNTPYFTGISIHGSQLNIADAEVLQAPMLFIRAGNDPSLDNITAVLNQKSFGSECEYKVYQNMTHGFVSAGANYSNPANVAAIDDVHQTVRTFLSKILTGGSTNIKASSLTIAFFVFFLNSLSTLCKQNM
jgi:dienelactone hydrolase